MHIEIINKDSFCVIGKKGSTYMGTGFIQKLWNEANTHFNEISNLVKRDDEEKPLACWGAMSDFSMSFMPWENNFTRGKYLAGAECLDEALAPEGWVKWTVPGFKYIKIRCDDLDTFPNGLKYLEEHGYKLVGAVHDFTDIKTGQNYMCFPIEINQISVYQTVLHKKSQKDFSFWDLHLYDHPSLTAVFLFYGSKKGRLNRPF